MLVSATARRYIVRARARGLSYRRIADDLASLRIHPPTARAWPYSTVRKIAMRDAEAFASLSPQRSSDVEAPAA